MTNNSADSRRLAYLDALGIDVWQQRGAAAADAAPAGEPPLAAGDAADPASMDWPQLAATVASCTRCALHRGRTQTVFGVGSSTADWMIIGEAPGAEEDRRGEPFVGRAGKLLDEMLRAVGCRREQVFIANILKCRPPGNRDPAADEAASCRAYLDRQIALVKPKLILAVGRIAAQQLLGSDAPLGRLRGHVHRLDKPALPVVVTYHPAYLLRSPAQKRKAWQDLCLARRVLAEATA
ncbi:MAG TPA: uracil-DNA glycosylase [Woeseiaceae bacterium]|nr:uracil-DNA glycosylase [Woeseiaceae bacterium]